MNLPAGFQPSAQDIQQLVQAAQQQVHVGLNTMLMLWLMSVHYGVVGMVKLYMDILVPVYTFCLRN